MRADGFIYCCQRGQATVCLYVYTAEKPFETEFRLHVHVLNPAKSNAFTDRRILFSVE